MTHACTAPTCCDRRSRTTNLNLRRRPSTGRRSRVSPLQNRPRIAYPAGAIHATKADTMGFMKKALLLGGVPVRPSTKRERSQKANIRAAKALERQTQLMEQAQRQPVPTQPPPGYVHAPGGNPVPDPRAPAGWYSDPWATATRRWWNGERWTEHIQ